jgi:hypothetical protein
MLAAVASLEALVALDLTGADRAELDRAWRHMRTIEAWLAVARVALIRRGDAIEASPRRAMEQHAGMSRRQVRDNETRAHTLGLAPAFEAALVAGRVTAAHVDAFARAVKATPELLDLVDALVEAASHSSPAAFEAHLRHSAWLLRTELDDDVLLDRQQRATKLTQWIDRSTGMYVLHGRFDPETGEKLWTAIAREVEASFHGPAVTTLPTDPGDRNDHLAALALAKLATTNDAGAPGIGTRRAELHCLIDYQTLVSGKHPESVLDLARGGRLPVSRVRQLACEADIIPIVLGGNGEVLDVGRSRRLATPAQRRALQAMYPTCALVPGCTVPFAHTQIHHLDDWGARRGPTDLGRLLPGCNRHHHDAHTGRIRVEMDPITRAITTYGRSGSVIARSSGPPGRKPRAP